MEGWQGSDWVRHECEPFETSDDQLVKLSRCSSTHRGIVLNSKSPAQEPPVVVSSESEPECDLQLISEHNEDPNEPKLGG
jgi:hypothetical protein